MPVTAKLSRKFYERLGDDIANELVNWFNSVDLSYRADLERLNELNFQRFDAKVDQRFAKADAKLEQRLAGLRSAMERRFAEADVKLEQRLGDFWSEMEGRFARIEVAIERQGSALRDEIANSRNGLMRWMFAFWATAVLAILGLYVGV
jgi:CRP-like cAMP-binding protein